MAMKMLPDPARHLSETGLLFEINRKVLHPYGLALVVKIDEDGAYTIDGIWDAREEEDGEVGIVFSAESLADGEAKLARFMAEQGTARLAARRKMFGTVVQRSEAEVPAPALASRRHPRLVPAWMIWGVGVLFFAAATVILTFSILAQRAQPGPMPAPTFSPLECPQEAPDELPEDAPPARWG